MSGVTLFACAGCALRSPIWFALGLYIGGVLMLSCLLLPYTSRMKQLWGLPRYRITDLCSLAMLMIWPIALGRIGLASYSLERVVICTLGLIACIGFLWFRGLWILQQLKIESFFRRTGFLAIVLPGILLVGSVVGYGITSSFVLLFGMRSFVEGVIMAAIQFAMVSLGIGTILTFLALTGLRHTLQQPTIPPTPASRPA